MKTKINLKNYIFIALFSAIISVCAFVTIPSPIPFTLQTLGVFCALTVLGGKQGFICIILYIFSGIIGLPVFAGFSGGIGYLAGATGGFIFGFVFTAIIYGVITHIFGNSSKSKAVGLFSGLLACYVSGAAWYTVFFLKDLSFEGFSTTLMICVVPFIIPDLIKIAVAILISKKLSSVNFQILCSPR